MRWDGTKWSLLETMAKTKDSKYTYFEAKTKSFSNFVITSLKGTAIEIPTFVVTETVTPSKLTEIEKPNPSPTKKTAGFDVVLAIVAVFSICVSRRMRR